MKINSQKQKQYQVYEELKHLNNIFSDPKPSLTPDQAQKQKKSLLEKYSFEDQDHSRIYEEGMTSQMINNDIDWLQMSVKQLTTIGKQLITFFLEIKYQIEYQIPSNNHQLNFNKNKSSSNIQNQPQVQIRQAKSKLVHGSVLESQNQSLILTLKCKDINKLNAKQIQEERISTLRRVQFSLIRIFQNKKQGKVIAKEFINFPRLNQQYETQFLDIESTNGPKPKPAAQMIFQINQIIPQQELNKEQDEQKQSQISQHLQISSPQHNKFENYTLGLPKKQGEQNPSNKKNIDKKTNNNVFDSNDNSGDDTSQISQQNSENHPGTVVKKLNELSKIIDNNLSRSKNQDAFHRNYLDSTSVYLEDLKNQNKYQEKQQIIRKMPNKPQVQQKQSETSQKILQPLNQSNSQRMNYISRFQNTKMAPLNQSNVQRYNYVSRIQNTKIPNEDQKFSDQLTPSSPLLTKEEIKKLLKNQGSQKDIINNQTLLKKGNRNNQHLKKGQINQQSPQLRKAKSDAKNQAYSRWIPTNLSELDSSNIRYKFEDNQLSNVEQSKQVQGLINQIQQIQKEWYKKRFLNKQTLDNKKQNTNKQINSPKIQEKNQYLNIQLKKFKFNFTEQKFYRRLIDSLKQRHISSLEKKDSTQKKNSKNIPENYIVYLKAHQVEQQQTLAGNDEEQFPIIEIKIPSDQIDKLLEIQIFQRQQNPMNTLGNPSQLTKKLMSKTFQKQIIKKFQKQLHSKVMKLKINKESNSDPRLKQKIKKKNRIIQIILEQEKDKNAIKKVSNLQDDSNKICLIGMYPIQMFNDEQKDLQSSFYQNISIDALSITMYNFETGDQEGKLGFQLKKGQVDKEIQTLQQLHDYRIEQQKQYSPIEKKQPKHRNTINQNRDESYQKQSSIQYVSRSPDARYNSITSKTNQVGKNHSNDKIDKKVNLVTLEKTDANRNTNGNSRTSNVHSFRSQVVANYHFSKDRPKKQNLLSNREFQGETQNFVEQENLNEESMLKKLKNSIKINGTIHRDDELLSSISKSRNVASKQQDLIGRIVKNPSTSLVQIPDQGFLNIQLTLPNNKFKQDQKRQNVSSKLNKKLPELSPQKAYLSRFSNNTQQTTPMKQIFSSTPKSNNSSYIMMKEQLQQTSDLISNLKIKTQKYIEKKQSDRKFQTDQNLTSMEDLPKSTPIQFQPSSQNIPEQVLNQVIQKYLGRQIPLRYTVQQNRIKKQINLHVNSSVFNQTIISKINKSRNNDRSRKSLYQTLPEQSSDKIYQNKDKKNINKSKSRNGSQEDPQLKDSVQKRNILREQKEKQKQYLQPNVKQNLRPSKNSKASHYSNASEKIQKQNPTNYKNRYQQTKDQQIRNKKKLAAYRHQDDYSFTEEQQQKYEPNLAGKYAINRSNRKQSVHKEQYYNDRSRDNQRYYEKSPQKLRQLEKYPFQKPIQIRNKRPQDLKNKYLAMESQPQIKSLQNQLVSKNLRSNKLPSSLSYLPDDQIVQVNIASIRIKLLTLPFLNKNKFTNKTQNDLKDYFVLVYTDINKQSIKKSFQLESSINQMSPVAQKCFRKQNSKDDQIIAYFDRPIEKSRSKDLTSTNNFLSLKGLETTKIHIELYQSQSNEEPRKNKNQYISYEQEEKINLITLSPSNKKSALNKNTPLGSVSVTFLQLIAQSDSIQPNQDDISNKNWYIHSFGKTFTNYTNFLYNNKKIVAKVNLNYKIGSDNNNNQEPQQYLNKKSTEKGKPIQIHRFSHSYDQNNYKRPRKDFYSNNSLKKNYKQQPHRYSDHQKYQNEHQQPMRSESGMTKKLAPRKKQQYKKNHKQLFDKQKKSLNQTQFKKIDHLDILKRRIPKPLKQKEQASDYSQSFNYRNHIINPTDVKRKKSSYVSHNSSSSSQVKAKKSLTYQKNKQSGYSSQFQEDLVPKNYNMKSPQYEYQEEESPKKALNLRNKQLPQLRQKKQQKKLQKLQSYKRSSVIRPERTEETRISHNKRYEGGNIKFGKSSRFNSESDSKQLRRKDSKTQIPGPGYYNIRSAFDRHAMKQP